MQRRLPKRCVVFLKKRLDLLLVERGSFPSREKARAAVMAGDVYADGQISDKPGTLVDEESVIEIRGDRCPYVGRGGLKLKKAVDRFGLSLTGLVAADFGASTGGFTDCMLQEGAARVYAADVGYGQLDYRLRTDPRVVVMERVNIRYLEPGAIPEAVDLVTVDVSFISLSLILPVADRILRDGGTVVCLVKPQFEAGRESVGKHGLVKDKQVHRAVLEKVETIGTSLGWRAEGVTHSPMTGAKGNIEYLLLFRKMAANEPLSEPLPIEAAVETAHAELGERG